MEQPPTAIAFSSDGSRAAIVLAAKRAQVWDVDRRRSLFSLDDIPFIVRTVQFSEDGHQVVLAGADKNNVKIKVWTFKDS